MLALYAQVIAGVLARRIFRGPKRPSWSWRYEIVSEFMRKRSESIEFDDSLLPIMREKFDEAGEYAAAQQFVHITSITANGVPGKWVLPKHGRVRGTMLYLHGGGYSFGSSTSHKGLLASFAHECDLAVLGIDYRLAPEHPCPAAIEDAVMAYKWLLSSPKRQGALIIAGDSAGGGLCVSTLQALRQHNLPQPACGILLSPWLDLRPGISYHDKECDYILPYGLDIAANFYAGTLSRHDPRVSPILGSMEGLPPLFVDAGGEEVLLEGCKTFVKTAKQEGVPVHFHIEPDELHVYPCFNGLNPRADQAFVRFSQFLKTQLTSGVSDKPSPNNTVTTVSL